MLDFDLATAAVWARLLARLKRKGLAMPINDNFIAATALARDLTVATRNTSAFRPAGVRAESPLPS